MRKGRDYLHFANFISKKTEKQGRTMRNTVLKKTGKNINGLEFRVKVLNLNNII